MVDANQLPVALDGETEILTPAGGLSDTGIADLAEKTEQDWRDEIETPFVTKTNPLLEWVNDLDVGALLSQIGVLQAIQAALDPLIDPLTVALLNANGDDQSTTITDQSSLLSDWSAAGNAKLVSAQKKFGTASIAFDGSGDYIYPSAAATNFAFGEGDFTIEMWVRSSTIAATQTLYDSGPTVQPRLQLSASKLVYVVDGQVRIQGTTTLASNTWYHVAVCRDGDSTRLFLNGQVEGLPWQDTTDYTNSSNRPRIGATVGGLDGMVGWIDSIRISKFARYDNNFPLPTTQPSQAVLTYLGEVFDDAFQVVFKVIAAGIDGLTTGLTTASVQAIIGGLQAIAAVGEGVWTVISDMVSFFITDNEIVAGLVDVFGDIISFFNDIITEFQNIPAWRDTLALVSNVITVINNITGGAFEVLELALDGLGDFFAGFLGEGSLLGQIVSQITGIAIDLITDPFDTLSNFFDTLPPLFDSVSVAILNANGANNSTTITDTSPLNANWTPTGNVRISTDIKKYGTGSMVFDGSGDWISPTAAPSSFSWGNQNFTVEMWIYPNSLASTGTLYDSAGAVLKIEDNRLTYAVGGTNRIQGATTLNFNQWYHVAVCRSGVNTRLFLNGQQQGGEWADSTVYTNTGVRVGATAAGTNGFSGHIDSLRLTKGLARYPGPFTPPSAEFPPAILNNLPFIGPIITAITDVTNGTIQDLVEFFGGVSSAAGSFIGQLVSGITGTAIELLTDPLGALNNWARGLDPVFQFFGDVIDAIVTALNTTLERVIDVVRAVVEFTIKLFTGFVNFGEMLDYLAKIFLSILAALGIVSGDDDQEFSLQYLLEGIANFFQQIPLIGPLITLMTGGARLNGQEITNLGQLGQWIFENMLRTDSALPARNLRGEFPWFLLPRFPIGHLDDVSPNLIEQNGFAAAAVMQEGGRWSWDGTVGEGAAKVTCTSSSATLYSNLIDVSKDQDLTLSVRVKWQGLAWNILASPVQIGLRTYLNGQIVSSNVMVANVPTINQVDRDFHTLEATWTVPAGVDKVRMSLGVTASASAGTVWFDDAQARKTNKLQQGLVGELVEAWNGLVDGLAGNQQGTSDLPRGSAAAVYTPSSGVQAAAAVAASTASGASTTATDAKTTTDAKSRGGSNLVLSPTFADTTITRLPVSSTTQGYTTQVSRSGVRSWSWVQVPNVDCGLYLAGTQTVRTFIVKAGERYTVEAYLYPGAGVAGTVTYGAMFTKAGAAGSTSSVITTAIPTAGQWTGLSTDVVVPAGYDVAEFMVVTNSPTAATFYLDDVTVREITNAAAAQDTADTAQDTLDTKAKAGTNLMLSPSFDDITVPRLTFGSGVTEGYSTAGQSRTGSRAWQFTQKASTNCGLYFAPTRTSADYLVKQDEKYELEAFVYPSQSTTGQPGGFRMAATYRNTKTSATETFLVETPLTSLVAGQWNKLTYKAQVPANYDVATFGLYTTNTVTAGRVFLIDDVTVREITLADTANSAASSAAGLAGGATTAATNASLAAGGAQTAAEGAQDTADTAQETVDTKARGGSNLVISPTFDDVNIERIPYTTSNVTQGYISGSGVSRSGSNSWRWVQRSATNCGLYLASNRTNRTLAVKAGERYFVEAYLNPTGSTTLTGQVQIGALFTDTRTTPLAPQTAQKTYALSGTGALTRNQFNQLFHEFDVPAGYDTAEFFVYATSATTANQTFYLDDVTVREITNAAAAASAASSAAGAANTATSNASLASSDVRDARDAVAIGLGGLSLGSTNATSSNVQSVSNTTRENVASLQAKIAALQSAAANAAYSGVAYSEDFSGYSAGALPFGKWGSVIYTSTGTNTGTVGIETTSGVPRAAWIGQSLDKRRGVVAYQSQLTSAYQKVGVVLSSTLNVGSKNYIYARGNSVLGNAVTAELTVPGPFQLATVRILVGTTQVGGTETFTYSPGSTYWLECGYNGNERNLRVLKDNLQIIARVEVGAMSNLTQFYTGFGLECNSDLLFRWEPADVAAFAAYDNLPVATRGSGFRISRTNVNAQAITAGTNVIPQFSWDTSGPTLITSDLSYNPVNHAVTVSVGGWYLVDVGLRLSAVISGNNTFAAACFRNGSVHGVGHQQWGTGVASFGRAAAGSWVVYCNPGDTLQAGYVASTNYSVVGTATGADTYFSIAFLSNTKPVNPPVT